MRLLVSNVHYFILNIFNDIYGASIINIIIEFL